MSKVKGHLLQEGLPATHQPTEYSNPTPAPPPGIFRIHVVQPSVPWRSLCASVPPRRPGGCAAGRGHVFVTAIASARSTGPGTRQVPPPGYHVLVTVPHSVRALRTRVSRRHSPPSGQSSATVSPGREGKESKEAILAGAQLSGRGGGGCSWPRRGTSQPGKVGGGRGAGSRRDIRAKKSESVSRRRVGAGRPRFQAGNGLFRVVYFYRLLFQGKRVVAALVSGGPRGWTH